MPPPKNVENAPHCALDVNERRRGQQDDARVGDPVDQLLRGRDRSEHRGGIATPHGGEEDVLVAPEHALGGPGRPTGVRKVAVVTGAAGCTTRGTGLDRTLVRHLAFAGVREHLTDDQDL